MSFSHGLSSDIDELFNKISQSTLLVRYLGITEVPCIINAPYRKDENASLSIYKSKFGNIRFKDFGTNENGDIIQLLMKIWNTSFAETKRKIVIDSNVKNSELQTKTKRLTKSKRVLSLSSIDVMVREWKDYDLEYWETYGISLPWLKFGDIYPISRIFFTDKNGERNVYPAEKYAYCYVEFKDGIKTLKIYQPYSKTAKWMSKHNSSVWDLWSKLPSSGDKLIITSSRKDALCIWENTGIPSTSLQGEGYIPKEKIVNQLKSRFEKIYVLYDNDFASDENYGRKDGERICSMFCLKQIELPEEYKCKDPSDFVKMHGRKGLYDIINKLINET